MPELFPFRALRYNASAVADLGHVLCPPYDVISAEERARVAALDRRNAVHVELPDSYEGAAETFARWQADGTLMRDERPQIYVYEQLFRTPDGGEQACRGFFCRLRLEPYGPESGVRPHEHTLSAAKEDRFQLMRAVRANLSPVLFLFDDDGHGETASRLLDELTSVEPDVEAIGPGGLPNRLWRADPSESPAARSLLDVAAAQPVYIADGHHRYETALRYCDEVGGSAAASVLALMYEAHSGGLALRPWHRLLRGVDVAELGALDQWFQPAAVQSPEELIRALARSPVDRAGVFGLWTAAGGGVLEPRVNSVGALQSADRTEHVRRLDVSVLSATLSRMFEATPEELAAEGRLTYADDARKALAEVESGKADAAFLVRPTPVEDVISVAAAGDYMPAKSTLFYPKAATGLVFNQLSD